MTTVSAEIFRAYDIRGIVDKTLTPASVELIGKAIASEAIDRGEHTIAVARDGRLSGPTLLAALCRGILSTGCNVIDIGAVPTPVLYYAAYTIASSGVMLTGSHNPPDYNGIKIVLGRQTLSGDAIQQLYQRITKQQFHTGHGKMTTHAILPDYYQAVLQRVKLARKLKVVIDCGNGITGNVAPALFQALGCDIIPLFCEVDGHFPNHHPDPSEPENLHLLMDAVERNQADVGLAFDGDGDRLGVVTDRGEIIWPDRQMMLFAIDLLSRHPQSEIIYDVKCSRHLRDVIQQHQGRPLMWKTGHSLLKAKLAESDALLAGEMSGHIFFKENWYGFDDGLYAGAKFLEILSKDKRRCSEIFHAIPDSINTPELKLPVTESQKWQVMERFAQRAHFPGAEINTIDGVRADFIDGWGLLRPSNTTPYLILRFEADNEGALQRIQQSFREQLLKIEPGLQLPF